VSLGWTLLPGARRALASLIARSSETGSSAASEVGTAYLLRGKGKRPLVLAARRLRPKVNPVSLVHRRVYLLALVRLEHRKAAPPVHVDHSRRGGVRRPVRVGDEQECVGRAAGQGGGCRHDGFRTIEELDPIPCFSAHDFRTPLKGPALPQTHIEPRSRLLGRFGSVVLLLADKFLLVPAN
jgi:hypothetical protein